jgi:hypothetical protein
MKIPNEFLFYGLGLKFQNLGLLGRVRVIGTGINLQFLEYLTSQPVLRQHSLDGKPHQIFWPFIQ